MNKKLAFGLCTLGLMTTAFSAQAEAFMRNIHAEVAALNTDTSPHLILVGNGTDGGGDPPGNDGGGDPPGNDGGGDPPGNDGGLGGHGGGHD